jgi:hypothetical protein
MNTFSLSDLYKYLVSKNAFIYHGAGVVKGVGNSSTNSLSYLDRLKNATTQNLEICCSTVLPGDSESKLNFFGRVGLIIWPNSHNSITLASPTDAGTTPDSNNPGRRNINQTPITLDALSNSIDSRKPNECNEWCIFDYKVIGLFIERPIYYSENDVIHYITLSDIAQNFPGMKIFTFCCGQLREIYPCGNWGSIVSISELYPHQ